ncbi:DUF1345 domain-containing protein [Humibacter ginsengiterrae]
MSQQRSQGRAWVRLIIVAAVGCIVGLIVGSIGDIGFGFAAGWIAASGLYVTWVWSALGRMDARATRAHATREDPGRTVGESVVLAASIASLGAVALVLIRAHQLHGIGQDLAAALALLTVASSWAIIHTRYMLRYARMYYTEPIGGIDFHGPVDDARYVDFGYLAFDLGQTFQVSDTNLLTARFRGVVLRHTLLSYVFSTAILATVINLVAGLG